MYVYMFSPVLCFMQLHVNHSDSAPSRMTCTVLYQTLLFYMAIQYTCTIVTCVVVICVHTFIHMFIILNPLTSVVIVPCKFPIGPSSFYPCSSYDFLPGSSGAGAQCGCVLHVHAGQLCTLTCTIV